MRESGTSVATETCGQSMPLKFRITFWEYWIWGEVTLSWRGLVTAVGGVTKNTGAGPSGGLGADSERRLAGGPRWHGEGALDGLDPEEGGHLRDLRVRLGHVLVAEEEGDVVGAAAKQWAAGVGGDAQGGGRQDGLVGGGVAQDGVRVVQDVLGDGSLLDEPGQVLRDPRGTRVAGGLAGERPISGVMLTGGIEGGPLNVRNVPCALSVVPCGIEAIRTRVVPSAGSLVAGTFIHTPGSKWMPMGFAGSVMSLTVSR